MSTSQQPWLICGTCKWSCYVNQKHAVPMKKKNGKQTTPASRHEVRSEMHKKTGEEASAWATLKCAQYRTHQNIEIVPTPKGSPAPSESGEMCSKNELHNYIQDCYERSATFESICAVFYIWIARGLRNYSFTLVSQWVGCLICFLMTAAFMWSDNF